MLEQSVYKSLQISPRSNGQWTLARVKPQSQELGKVGGNEILGCSRVSGRVRVVTSNVGAKKETLMVWQRNGVCGIRRQ